MSTATDVLSLVTPARVSPNGEAYFTLADGKRIVEQSASHDAVILGIEIFTRDGKFIQPRFNEIFDASDDLISGLAAASINDKARQFLQQLPNDPDLLVNFVVVDARR